MALGLLSFGFRRSARWLHQHIFKVGWLLTNNYRTTTLLYYILFLPGILLHEACLWLLAGLLRLRAERAIRFPETQEIGELRLNFIRLSPQSGRLRAAFVTVMPLLLGILALWLLADFVFRWEVVLATAGAGGIDALADSLRAALSTADFWLWFYLAFTIANTMFPARSLLPQARHRALAALLLLIGARLAWSLDAAASQTLLQNLGMALLQVLAFNLLVVAILGTFEALFERATGRSATFTEGKMIAMTRAEAQAFRASQRAAKQPTASRAKPKPLRSIYDLPLPIPGPPGREPISRQVVSVVMPPAETPAPPVVEPPPAPPPPPIEPPPPESPSLESIRARQDAPFSRPFTAGDSEFDDERWRDDEDDATEESSGFARPFANAAAKDAMPPIPANPPAKPASLRKPRPVPKPGKPPARPKQRSADAADNELTYEPLDDMESYPDDDGIYYDDDE